MQCCVDDVGDESVVDWRVAVEQSVIKGAVEQVERDIDADAGLELATLGRSLE